MRNLEKDEREMAERRERILSTGFRLFAERGIEQVTMQELARACDLSIATLYRYYKNKLELVIAIHAREWQKIAELFLLLREQWLQPGYTAAQELEYYLDGYIELYENHKDLLRFNQSFNNFVRNEKADREQMKPYLQTIGIFAGRFHTLYLHGREDGTIRTDLPEEKMLASTMHIMLAVAVRFAQGLVFSAEHEADRLEELELLKRMMLREYVVPPEERGAGKGPMPGSRA